LEYVQQIEILNKNVVTGERSYLGNIQVRLGARNVIAGAADETGDQKHAARSEEINHERGRYRLNSEFG